MFVLWYTCFNGGETNEHVSLELQNSWLVEGDEMNTRAPRFLNNLFFSSIFILISKFKILTQPRDMINGCGPSLMAKPNKKDTDGLNYEMPGCTSACRCTLYSTRIFICLFISHPTRMRWVVAMLTSYLLIWTLSFCGANTPLMLL